MGPLISSQISTTTSLYLRPLLAISDGLVVTPSTRPMAAASRISPTSPVSMKNFIGSLPRAMLGNGLEPLRCVLGRFFAHLVARQLRAQLGTGTGQIFEATPGTPGLVGDLLELVGEWRHMNSMYGPVPGESIDAAGHRARRRGARDRARARRPSSPKSGPARRRNRGPGTAQRLAAPLGRCA